MALKIETDITEKSGSPVPSGAYLVFDAIFPSDRLEVHCNLKVYRDKQAYDDGLDPIRPSEFNVGQVIGPLSQSAYDSLDNSSVHDRLKSKLEEVLGSGTISKV